jgi:hypothetical protein
VSSRVHCASDPEHSKDGLQNVFAVFRCVTGGCRHMSLELMLAQVANDG